MNIDEQTAVNRVAAALGGHHGLCPAVATNFGVIVVAHHAHVRDRFFVGRDDRATTPYRARCADTVDRNSVGLHVAAVGVRRRSVLRRSLAPRTATVRSALLPRRGIHAASAPLRTVTDHARYQLG